MTFTQRKQLVLASWVASVAIAGPILAVDKPDLWMWIATLAFAPAAIGNWLWNAPEPTLTQLIAAARRDHE